MTSLEHIKGIGTQLASRLKKLGITNIFDIVFHLPRSYQDRTLLKPLSELQLGEVALIEGEIVQVEILRGRKQMLLCHIHDSKGYLVARFFHFNRYQLQQMQAHHKIRCFGEVRAGRHSFEMIHPEYQLLNTSTELPLQQELTPLYPTTEGITQTRLRKLILQVLGTLTATDLPEYLPKALSEPLQLPSLLEALRFVHQPPREVDLALLQSGQHPMQQRLIMEELLAHRLSLRRSRQQLHLIPAPILPSSKKLIPKFLKQLSFQLTNAQQRVSTVIAQNLTHPAAMLRLLQGDVGSGKTAIAELAALQAIEAGYQVALMAPTEILAEQHYQHLQRDFIPLKVKVGCLTSKLKARDKKQLLHAIASGEVSMIIGTQALFQSTVVFQKLALVIIDEQHRFGVAQRHALQQKGYKKSSQDVARHKDQEIPKAHKTVNKSISTHDNTAQPVIEEEWQPHQLIMTATPIPRTLAMTSYADLDISILDELPPGRTPVKTVLVSNQRRTEVTERIANACQAGRQAYWVCPLIEESEVLNCQAAEATVEHLRQELPQLNIGLIHGRVKPQAKTDIMQQFQDHQLDLLVATTVIEVGVNVPNASLMIIENAERLGLSQLHQLRGRVGRGSTESFCVLMYQTPLSETAQARLQIMRATTDGFKIAEQDLVLRGPGEVLGTRQTGEMNFKIAALLRDQPLLSIVQQFADQILDHHPELVTPLIQRWLGNVEQYARV